jgi:hypothetical protein
MRIALLMVVAGSGLIAGNAYAQVCTTFGNITNCSDGTVGIHSGSVTHFSNGVVGIRSGSVTNFSNGVVGMHSGNVTHYSNGAMSQDMGSVSVITRGSPNPHSDNPTIFGSGSRSATEMQDAPTIKSKRKGQQQFRDHKDKAGECTDWFCSIFSATK